MNSSQGGLAQGVSRKLNPDGSMIIFDRAGAIVATTDVLGERREFQLEPGTGKLMVKRFGLWTAPEQARVDVDGSLYFKRNEMEILERLDGVHIHANKSTGVTIKTDNKNRVELVELSNGEVWKRQTTDDVEQFWIWKNQQPSFRSETYFRSTRQSARTPSGAQALSYVSRHEESWERGAIVREKFSFNNEVSNERHVAVALQIGRAMLMLRNVTAVLTFFSEGNPSETIYTLSQPTTLRIDLPVMKGAFEDVVEVRSFINKTGRLAYAFKKPSGSEQVINVAEAG